MLIRYGKSQSGKRIKVAEIYTLQDHRIGREKIDKGALFIADRLNAVGYKAYIVGGAVRDLLLEKKPKDFDVVTNATPETIRKLFRRSRIVGNRFQLVHVYLPDKVIEVSTFRSGSMAENNYYGTLKEDVSRRDFTVNALYYCPCKQQILDFKSGMKDLRERRLRLILPLERVFVEDPVRILRAVKYAVITGFRLPGKYRRRIRKDAKRLENCPSSRLTEELFKILESGSSYRIFEMIYRLEVLRYLLPSIYSLLKFSKSDAEGTAYQRKWFKNLKELDRRVGKSKEVKRSSMIVAMVLPFLSLPEQRGGLREVYYTELFYGIKSILKPLTPPNRDVDEAVKIILKNSPDSVTEKPTPF